MGPAVLFPLLLLLLLLPPLVSPSSSTTTQPPDLATCLSSAGVRNFTLPFVSTSSFYNLLDFSIQNLRFTRPSLPKPSAVILPETSTDLQNTILCCRRSALTIRIRSGGHSYEGLSYLADRQTPFALIDLMNLNRVRIDPISRTAWVEAGATLGEVYHAISISSMGHGHLGFSAGSCPTVGSGGHIAGGGFGLLSRKHGLAADNVVDAILIDAKGRVMDSRSMGDDVFWAIRDGGGGTWGAVYAWRLRLVPVPPRVTCFVINRPGSTGDVAGLVDRWQRVAPELPDEFYLSVFVGARLPDSAAPGLSATFKGFFLGRRSEAESVLNQRFPELNVTESDWSEMSWIDSVVFFSGLPKGSTVSDLTSRYLNPKTYFKAKSNYVQAHIELKNLIRAFRLLEEEPKAYLILDPYGGAMARVRSDRLPFPHRGGNLYTIQYLIEWKEDEDDESKRYVDWLRRFYDSMEESVSRGPRAAYVNYLDLDLGTTVLVNSSGEYRDAVTVARTWGEKYFLGNYNRLVRAKTAIDVENVFSNIQSIPPLALGPKLDYEVSGEASSHSAV